MMMVEIKRLPDSGIMLWQYTRDWAYPDSDEKLWDNPCALELGAIAVVNEERLLIDDMEHHVILYKGQKLLIECCDWSTVCCLNWEDVDDEID